MQRSNDFGENRCPWLVGSTCAQAAASHVPWELGVGSCEDYAGGVTEAAPVPEEPIELPAEQPLPSSEAAVAAPVTPGRLRKKPPFWAKWPDDKLLDLRMSDLGVTIEGGTLQKRLEELNQELAERGISFRPHFWLSDEWFTPDGVPGVAIPFYLAHPRLARLEREQMLEVEGGTPSWCMRILRHEAGHAIDHAYMLHRRRRRQALFGSSSTPYPEFYTPKPYSRSFVLHIDNWYAQSHPDEDFAETFAVWLNPRSDWRRRYQDWPALKKLEYMDELMREIATAPPLVGKRKTVDPLHRIRRTLRQHYKRKAKHYGLDYPDFYDRDLRRLFPGPVEGVRTVPASRFINRIRRDVRRTVAAWTGVYQYTIDQVLEEMAERCDELQLRFGDGAEERTRSDFIVVLTVQTMNYLHSGRHRVAL
jgi:Putative zinc-binding metallo-peptidase